MAALAIAASFAGGAPAQSTAHSHDTAAPHPQVLDPGRKWPTDAALRQGMGRIRDLVEPQLAPAHAGKLSRAQYRALAMQIESEVGGIVANCKLEPEADAVLHRVIADLGAGSDAMAGKDARRKPVQGLAQVAQAVNAYGRTFDDPGFAAIAH
jgi:hypothetical protein